MNIEPEPNYKIEVKDLKYIENNIKSIDINKAEVEKTEMEVELPKISKYSSPKSIYKEQDTINQRN